MKGYKAAQMPDEAPDYPGYTIEVIVRFRHGGQIRMTDLFEFDPEDTNAEPWSDSCDEAFISWYDAMPDIVGETILTVECCVEFESSRFEDDKQFSITEF